MANERNFWTQPRSDGKWETKREGGQRASKISETQAEAWEHTKDQARGTKGEAFLKNREGRIRERNTYGKDPRRTKG